MVEDARKNPRLIGGVYQVGQVITTGPILTVYTAYNRNTNDVVGLLVLELPPQFEAEAALRLLEPLKRRRLVQSPHVIHVYDWGIDSSRAYIATAPPRGITLRHVLDNETIEMHRAVGMAQQIAVIDRAQAEVFKAVGETIVDGIIELARVWNHKLGKSFCGYALAWPSRRVRT